MTRVLILGGTGMLGSAVGNHFLGQSSFDVFLTARDMSLAYGNKSRWIKFDPTGQTMDAISHLPELFSQMPENPDIVINCIGTIKPFINKDPAHSVLLNSLFPHELASYCKAIGVKVLHITTDCVFSGSKGNYSESDAHDCLDMYGKSKSIGEPANCMVVRTSIIGPELHKNASLIAWAQSQKGNDVNGFSNHLWNGLTTLQYAKVCQQIIDGDLYSEGTFHVFSNKVTKAELLRLIDERYKLGLKIKVIDAVEACDRSLTTVKGLMGKLKVPSLEQQLSEI